MELSPQNDYSIKRIAKPKYRYDQVTPQVGGQTVTINATGGNNSTFELVARPFNIAESILAMDIKIAAQANDFVNGFVQNLPVIRQLQFYGKNNVMLADITNFDVYSKVMASADFSQDELDTLGATPLFRNNGYLTGGIGAVPAVTDEKMAGTRTAAAVGPPLVYEQLQIGKFLRYEDDDAFSLKVGQEPQYYVSGGADNKAVTLRYRIPLGFFKNTIFAYDKDVLFPDVTYIRMIFNSLNEVGFDADDPTKANPGALVAVTVENLSIYQAMQTNESINSALQANLDSGNQNLLIDYVHCTTQLFAASTTQNWYVKYGPSMGMKLKRIYWTVLPTTPTADQRYNTTNINGAKVTSFSSKLDGQFIQFQSTINCVTDPVGGPDGDQDYMVLRKQLRGGVSQSKDVYKYNWFWCENFGSEDHLHDHDSNIEHGLDITTRELKYDVLAATANVANTHYIFGVAQRKLSINRLGITLM